MVHKMGASQSDNHVMAHVHVGETTYIKTTKGSIVGDSLQLLPQTLFLSGDSSQ